MAFVGSVGFRELGKAREKWEDLKLVTLWTNDVTISLYDSTPTPATRGSEVSKSSPKMTPGLKKVKVGSRA